MQIRTIENTSLVDRIEYHPMFSAICSVGLSPFSGTIDIAYTPGNRLLEFESFETFLRLASTKELTIEDVCRMIFDSLTEALGEIPLKVTVNAKTLVHASVEATIERKLK